MNEYLEIFVRSIIAMLTLIIIARTVGVRQISQLTFYDYVTGITIGSIAGALAIDNSIPIGYSVLAMALFGIINLILSIFTNKSIILRRLLTGKAKFMIYQGEFVQKNMTLARFDVNDILRELRNQGYFNVADIAYAILETNGKLSVLPKSGARPANACEANIPTPQATICADVIIDGKIMEENLSRMDVNKNWLVTELAKQGIKNIKNIMLANLNENKELCDYLKKQTDKKMSTIFE